MGQKLTVEERRNIKREVYMIYPGLEQQLEMAFTCHDLQHEGKLPYTTLEPIIRHLLMQYGLIEYVTRFSDSEGCLDANQIRAELNEFGVNTGGLCCGSSLTLEDFKSLAVIWLRKILDCHADDQAVWMAKLKAEQEEQAEAYTRAMREFQDTFTQQHALYQQGLQEQQKQINDWNKLLEDAQKTQQTIYEQEVRRMEEARLKEATAAEEAMKEQIDLISQYKEKLEKIAAADTSGKCFVYPAAATPYGACASAGAQEPTRRRRVKKEHPSRACC
ncbi:hypothetical protein TGME49_313380 [Toxoplasma gondii ME49]|uniref:Uncharacterized protein n=14 Tax=Toxoplasma gondii TaxID=5811 RepID=B9PIK4_TOXGV|nr:hypothetical protein TGME49_313380 [Toxoplasma gondii ME49]EPR60942.1 hypothetical protein TGGT1_313380 [Toxoplasma gondii GT1]ESS35068.1 hypothetical protein TGVEG_313380 [Toxoplasma gondii VEG]KFG37422.1 hypothetical protein TGDOM2_313380 [Toxoplasma gondii GAB2-2007-GAL-DOM2]KFG50050.1 hypothetical protein TGP89_313380 [Toxoplasma gondii p89]KFG56113.1 hypothetical protein TGFOU_313380 [Toxoplasma gondii FOU]KFG66111.1 hypothetical protein TGRUB_313380 [Toxoplasma gondii RUB]KFH09818.1|eukprot:XP_018635430.1 hypothetical protein TGME49_313380 [Toxoplasma gondii ME49]